MLCLLILTSSIILTKMAFSHVKFPRFPNVDPGYNIVRKVENPVYLPDGKTQMNNNNY